MTKQLNHVLCKIWDMKLGHTGGKQTLIAAQPLPKHQIKSMTIDQLIMWQVCGWNATNVNCRKNVIFTVLKLKSAKISFFWDRMTSETMTARCQVTLKKTCVFPKLLFTTYASVISQIVGSSDIIVADFFSWCLALNENPGNIDNSPAKQKALEEEQMNLPW